MALDLEDKSNVALMSDECLACVVALDPGPSGPSCCRDFQLDCADYLRLAGAVMNPGVDACTVEVHTLSTSEQGVEWMNDNVNMQVVERGMSAAGGGGSMGGKGRRLAEGNGNHGNGNGGGGGQQLTPHQQLEQTFTGVAQIAAALGADDLLDASLKDFCPSQCRDTGCPKLTPCQVARARATAAATVFVVVTDRRSYRRGEHWCRGTAFHAATAN
jgi:hypothetical protein